MPKINEMIESKYLKKEDADEERVVTIQGVKRDNIAREDENADMKWMVKFKEFNKPMILNSTNIQLLALACGSDDSDDWKGKQVILWSDPTVAFAGKLVGGLRIKPMPKGKKQAVGAANTSDGPKFEDAGVDENGEELGW